MSDRELDALVAERVMGCKPRHAYGRLDCSCKGGLHSERFEPEDLLRYSTTGDGMLAVIEAIVAKGWYGKLSVLHPSQRIDGTRYRMTWTPLGNDENYYMDPYGEAESLPRAVCLAALKAVGVEV